MEKNILVKFQEKLRSHRKVLANLFNSLPEEKRVQCCGNSSCDINPIIEKYDDALEKIDRGEFGKCKICHEDVEIERLELDFTTEVCLGHYSDDELKFLERDLELAAKVQQQLLPSRLPVLKEIKIAAHSEPAKIVSGDYFDFFPYHDSAQGIIVADVMGKGLPASMLMSNLQASLRILGSEYKEMNKLATRLNELFRFNLKLVSFITLLLVRIDLQSRIIQYCNAGHNPGLIWKPESKEVIRLNPTGPAIGLIGNPMYKSAQVKLDKGDVLLLYTDGITEARNKNEEEFGEKKLIDYLKENCDKSPDKIISELRKKVKEFSGQLQDDSTLVVVK